jgi:hypothetical protein
MRSDADTAPARPFTAVIEAFPDMAVLARTLGVPHSTVAAWKRRDQIPEARWASLEAAAKALKIRGITYRSLAATAARRRQQSESTADAGSAAS